MKGKDITSQVRIGINDGDLVPLERCACGAEYKSWEFVLSTESYNLHTCEKCGRRMYFEVEIKVFEVVDE